MSTKAKFWLGFFAFIILCPNIAGYVGIFLSILSIPIALIVLFVVNVNDICDAREKSKKKK